MKILKNLKNTIKIFPLMVFAMSLTACTVGNLDRSKVISAPRDYELTILSMGDTNGQAEGGQNTGIGYSRFSTILNRARLEFGKENVLYLDAGNTFYGSRLAEADKGESIVKILNALNIDAMTLGKNDFNYGEKNIKSLEMRANFKILASNIKKQDGHDFVTPYIVKNINGVKVGIFGLVSPDIYNNEKALLDTITIEEPIVAATKTVKELKSLGAEFIIALTNLGMDNNLNREWQSSAVAESVSGIDLIIDGNNKTPLEDKTVINETVIIRTGENMKNIGVLKIDFDAPKRDSERIFYKLIKKEDIVTVEDTSKIAEYGENISNSINKAITHTVEKGDTLYSLAKKYGTTVNEIVALNPEIADGQNIKIGSTYVMTAAKNTVVNNIVKNSGFAEHTVVKGDTLYSLAKKYGTTVAEVVALNPEITDGQSIKIGNTYKFPTNTNSNATYEEPTYNEENINNNFDEEALSSEMPDVDTRTNTKTSIEKDPKIEALIAKIKVTQSIIK